MKYLNIIVAIMAFLCAPLMAQFQSNFSDSFKKGFAEVVQSTPAEQPGKIDALKATIGEKEILIIRVAVDSSASEADIHFYLGDLALEFFHPDNPWGINTPGGIPMEVIPWNLTLKSVNHPKQMSWENGLMGGLGPWRDTHREHVLALPVLVRWTQEGVFNIVPAPDPATTGEWQLDTSQWQVSEGLTLQQDRRRYVKELPHHPWFLLTLGEGKKRRDSQQEGSAKSLGNLSYLSWAKTPLGEKQKVSHVVYRELTRVIIPAGKTVNGKWTPPSLAEAQAKARQLDGPSTNETLGTPVASAPKIQEIGSQVSTPATPTTPEPVAVATPVPPTEPEKVKEESQSAPTTAKEQSQPWLTVMVWALAILSSVAFGLLLFYSIKRLKSAKSRTFDSSSLNALPPQATKPSEVNDSGLNAMPPLATAETEAPQEEKKS
jgi:hypothetical protein